MPTTTTQSGAEPATAAEWQPGNPPRCCRIGCTRLAEFNIQEKDTDAGYADDYTHACREHVGDLLGNNGNPKGRPEHVWWSVSQLAAEPPVVAEVTHGPTAQSGAELIAAERKRQVEQDGSTAEHDDRWAAGQMANAAASYATTERIRDGSSIFDPSVWPWPANWWKPTPTNRVRELVKAGALIAAEIDRLQRAR